MNILILGMDGYIGWPLAMHLSQKGHTVSGIDNMSRRKNVRSVGSDSAFPIQAMEKRIKSFEKLHHGKLAFFRGDLLNYSFLTSVIKKAKPDTIIHLGEQPSAPFSMIDREHAIYTQHNNIENTLNVLYAMKEFAPESHLVKLGTMGEYGTPNVDIPEGFFELEFRGRKDILPFPRSPGSLYHLSKVHDSGNTQFACRVWGLKSTDIMQGVVYGTRTDEITDDSLLTRFDFDESFGTVINRYCAQAVCGHYLTPYGKGQQRRGFIDLVDSIQCLTIATENPPEKSEYRVFNQLDEVYGITELAELVAKVGKQNDLDVEIKHVKNFRVEKEEHYYKVDNSNLKKLGFKPTRNINTALEIMLRDLKKYKQRIIKHKSAIAPKTSWK